MKKIEIYKEDRIQISTVVDDDGYSINTYTNSFDISCKIGEIEITYSIPLNEGYRIIVEI